MLHFGPIIQDYIVEILEEAGLGKIFADGNNPEEKLKSLLQKIEDWNPNSRLYEVFSEISSVSGNLQYVYRYEMRPAVDFCDPALWVTDKDDEPLARKQLNQVYASCETDVTLVESLPSDQQSTEEIYKVLRDLSDNSYKAVAAILKGGRCRLSKIAEDVMKDSLTRLCYGEEVEEEWRSFLRRVKGYILKEKVDAIQAKSARVAEFRTHLNKLDELLNN